MKDQAKWHGSGCRKEHDIDYLSEDEDLQGDKFQEIGSLSASCFPIECDSTYYVEEV